MKKYKKNKNIKSKSKRPKNKCTAEWKWIKLLRKNPWEMKEKFEWKKKRRKNEKKGGRREIN